MCVSQAGRIVEFAPSIGAGRPALVEFDGVMRRVDLIMTPAATVGDHVIVHSGYALRVVSASEARTTAELWNAVEPGPVEG